MGRTPTHISNTPGVSHPMDHHHTPLEQTPSSLRRHRAGMPRMMLPLLVGAAVATALWLYGSLHKSTGTAVNLAGFTNAQSVKSWLSTVAAAFAIIQLFSAQAMWGKVPGAPHLASISWISPLHRWSGRVAFLFAVPVAVHCLYALGTQTFDVRTTLHSLFGCFFFGAFTTKMLSLRSKRLPGWTVPLLGGLVFTVFVVLWTTSAGWFFGLYGIHY
ncbi:DUF6529 family protein [Streptomyces sp. NPDC093595]|uniref:DUF6529 family protein n=1 Tax=Streptomyces sp. NPDC093595 TaxID=3366045 RepID=UPI003815584F